MAPGTWKDGTKVAWSGRKKLHKERKKSIFIQFIFTYERKKLLLN